MASDVKENTQTTPEEKDNGEKLENIIAENIRNVFTYQLAIFKFDFNFPFGIAKFTSSSNFLSSFS